MYTAIYPYNSFTSPCTRVSFFVSAYCFEMLPGQIGTGRTRTAPQAFPHTSCTHILVRRILSKHLKNKVISLTLFSGKRPYLLLLSSRTSQAIFSEHHSIRTAYSEAFPERCSTSKPADHLVGDLLAEAQMTCGKRRFSLQRPVHSTTQFDDVFLSDSRAANAEFTDNSILHPV